MNEPEARKGRTFNAATEGAIPQQRLRSAAVPLRDARQQGDCLNLFRRDHPVPEGCRYGVSSLKRRAKRSGLAKLHMFKHAT